MAFTLSALCTALSRHPGVIQDIQKRFGLPVLKGAAYSDSYAAFLRTIVNLRIFGISFEKLEDLWSLEKSVMHLLHADSTDSPTWFLDSCGAKGHRSRRLLLSNYDLGSSLSSGSVQLGLNFSAASPELFTSAEMGEDVLQAINLYLKKYRSISVSLQAELPTLRTALRFSKPHLPAPS